MIKLAELSIRIHHKDICRNLNLVMNSGEIWGMIGANGCGKTTFLHTLAGLLPMKSGEIYIDNLTLSKTSAKTLAKKIGILFQENITSFSQTVFEYCLSGRHPHLPKFSRGSQCDKEITMNALYAMELEDKIQKKIHQLSGGEKRRLNIATLLAQTPDIYLLDEPTNHLDIRQQYQVLDHFRQLAKYQNKCIILSLHSLEWIKKYCTHVIMIFKNAEVISGLTDAIMTPSNLSRLYNFNFEKVNEI